MSELNSRFHMGVSSLAAGHHGIDPNSYTTIVLNDRHIGEINKWLTEIDDDGIRAMEELVDNGVFKFYNMSSSKRGRQSGVIAKENFDHHVMVPLMVVTTGLQMTTKQTGLMESMKTFVSESWKPAEYPHQNPEFVIRYVSHRSGIAVPGRMTSMVGSEGSTHFDVTVRCRELVCGITFGDSEMWYTSDPSIVTRHVMEGLMKLATKWANSFVVEHMEYLAGQPELAHIMAIGSRLHQPHTSQNGRMVQYYKTVNALAGSVNRSSKNMMRLLEGAAKIVGSESGEIVAVITKRTASASGMETLKKTVSVSKDCKYYQTNEATGMKGYCYFGESFRPLNRGHEDVTDHDLKGNVSFPRDITDKGSETNGNQLEVDYVNLPSGQNVYLIVGDNTEITGNGMTLEDSFINDGITKTFMTVGGIPSIWTTNPSMSFLENNGHISASKLMESGLDETYFMDYDTETISRITVRECNSLTNTKELFDPKQQHQKFLDSYGRDSFGYVNQDSTALKMNDSLQDLLSSSNMMYETNPRLMCIRTGNNIQNYDPQTPLAGTESVSTVERLVLGNASPLYQPSYEYVSSIAPIYIKHRYAFEKIETFIQLVKNAMADVVRSEILKFREVDLSAGLDSASFQLMKDFYNNKFGLQSDPYCIEVAMAMEKYFRNFNSTQDADKEFMKYKNSYFSSNPGIIEYNSIVQQAKEGVEELLKSFYMGEKKYNYIMMQDKPLVSYPTNNGPLYKSQSDWFKFTYGIMYPAFTMCTLGQPPANNMAHPADMAANFLTVTHKAEHVFVLRNHTEIESSLERIGHPRNANRFPNMVRNATVGPARDVYYPYSSIGEPLFTHYFLERYNTFKHRFGLSDGVMVAALTKWWTIYNYETVEKLFDVTFPSGMAYLVLRAIKYKGHGAAVVPVKGARYIESNKAAAFPRDSWTQKDYVQMKQCVVTPKGVSSLGTFIPNVFWTDVRGGGSSFNFDNPDCSIIMDSYPYYVPESKNSWQAGGVGMLNLYGYSNLNGGADDENGMYTQLPTTFCQASLLMDEYKKKKTGDNNHTIDIITAGFNRRKATDSLPPFVLNNIMGSTSDSAKRSIMAATTGGNTKSREDTFTAENPFIFSECYGIGNQSSSKLRHDNPASSVPLDEFQPLIYAQAGIGMNGALRNGGSDPLLMGNFVKSGMAKIVTCLKPY